jgi:hypothetical protein
MWALGVDPLVIPNGLPGEAFEPPDRTACAELRRRFADRTVMVKIARFDPDKRWLAAVKTVGLMKRTGWRPLLVARGGAEAHGGEVLDAMRSEGLVVVERQWRGSGGRALLEVLRDVNGADVVHLRSPLDSDARRVLLRGGDAVLANSGHEPFGLVGLETMAAGGLACTGATGEDYAVPGRNARCSRPATPQSSSACSVDCAADRRRPRRSAGPGARRRAISPGPRSCSASCCRASSLRAAPAEASCQRSRGPGYLSVIHDS